MGTPEGEKSEKGTEEIFKTTMTKNFLKLPSDIKPKIQEAQRIPRKINAKTPHYIQSYNF